MSESKFVVKDMEFKNKSDAARHFGINIDAFYTRLRNGWTHEQAVGIENPPERKGKPVTVRNIEFPSIASASDFFGIDPRLAGSRLAKGWTANRAFTALPGEGRKRHKNKKTLKLGPQRIGNLEFKTPTAMLKYYNAYHSVACMNRLKLGSPPERVLAHTFLLLERSNLLDENKRRIDEDSIPSKWHPKIITEEKKT